jgi:hypothetical protein
MTTCPSKENIGTLLFVRRSKWFNDENDDENKMMVEIRGLDLTVRRGVERTPS